MSNYNKSINIQIKCPVAIMDKAGNVQYVAKSIHEAASMLGVNKHVVQSILHGSTTHPKYNLRKVDPLELMKDALDLEGYSVDDLYNNTSDFSEELEGIGI